jgi:hypothetical protein
VEFAVMKVEAGLAELIEIGEDLLDSSYVLGFSGDVDGVGTEVDVDLKAVLEEAEVFVTCAIERLDAWGDFNRFFDQ